MFSFTIYYIYFQKKVTQEDTMFIKVLYKRAGNISEPFLLVAVLPVSPSFMSIHHDNNSQSQTRFVFAMIWKFQSFILR